MDTHGQHRTCALEARKDQGRNLLLQLELARAVELLDHLESQRIRMNQIMHNLPRTAFGFVTKEYTNVDCKTSFAPLNYCKL